MLWLLSIVCVLPFLELWAMLALGRHIGLLPTVAVVLGAGLAGASLARHQGLRAVGAISREMQAGRTPALEMLDAAGLLLAGGLLLLPGLISDVLGIALLWPPLRRAVLLRAMRWAHERVQQGVRDGTITVHAIRVEPDATTRAWRPELGPARDQDSDPG